MRFVVIALLLAACHPVKTLVRAMDPLCYTPCWQGQGHPGVGTCTEGTWQCDDNGDLTICKDMGTWQPTDPCDGLDNNCDGIVDHEYESCYNGCGSGMHQCIDGKFPTECYTYVNGVQRELVSTPEVCNGLDDDCNGQIDDLKTDAGTPIACYPPGDTGLGICHPGTLVCDAWHNQICLNAGLPMAEVCNGLDDDCNGKVDDGLGNASAFDIVFIIDNSGSMADKIQAVNTSVQGFSIRYANDPNYKFALVRITNITNDGVVFVDKNFVDANTFAIAVNKINVATGGGDEASLDSLAEVANYSYNPLNLNWRAGSKRYQILFTDEHGQSWQNPTLTIADVEAAVDSANPVLHTYIFTLPTLDVTFGNVCAATSGAFYDVTASDAQLEVWLNGILATTCQP